MIADVRSYPSPVLPDEPTEPVTRCDYCDRPHGEHVHPKLTLHLCARCEQSWRREVRASRTERRLRRMFHRHSTAVLGGTLPAKERTPE